MARELGHELQPIEDVRAEILSSIAPLPAETCALAESYDRVLREDVAAPAPLPPFDNSAMDGYAVRSADLAAASPARPVSLRVMSVVPAGSGEVRTLEAGAAIPIMTGAPLPSGADCVVPRELVRVEGDAVRFEETSRPGANVRRRGSDLRPGDVPLRAGQRLRGPQLALAAALRRASLVVGRRPRVAIISPGDELVEPGQEPGPGQISSSNQYALIGLLREAGAEPLPLGIVPDRRSEIRATMAGAAAAGADAIITTGGVSAGDYDFVQAIAREEGAPGRVYKVAMRPGKPLAFAVLDGIPLLGLPGNPASAVISFLVFARPILRRMLGEKQVFAERFPVRFRAPYRYRPGRVFFLRARVEPDAPGEGGGFHVAEVGEQDSSVISSLSLANALVVLPAGRDLAPSGEEFPAEWIHG
jgi:molybdopterin molybdotransferase